MGVTEMTDYSWLLDELRSCGGGICPANCQFFDLRESGHNCEGVLMAVAADTIEELQSMLPRWIPVTERLPEDEEGYLVFNGYGVSKAQFDMEYGVFVNLYPFYKRVDITHWMPLPPPPQEGEQE